MSTEELKYLFIDDAFIESIEGIKKGVVPAEKVSVEPLIEKDQPWEKSWMTGEFFFINVIYDEEENLFKMWYDVGRSLSSDVAEEEVGLAYAVSEDGIHWKKPILNLIEDNGSKKNNLLFPFFRWGFGHVVIKDSLEADPAKRYKMLFMFQCEEMKFAGIVQPVCLAYSSDGIHWQVPQNWFNPVIPGASDTHLTAYWDAQIHKYVVYLRGRPNVRLICMSESEDFINWSPRKIIIQPDEEDPAQDHEFYGMTSMAYGEFRVGFLSIFHTLNEGWIRENQIEEWMPEWMNQLDIQLTYSKDGRTWHRAGNREPILKCGEPGSFDCGGVYAAHTPLKVGDEIWLYYAGGNILHGEPPRHGEKPREGISLAKIKKDRFVCLRTEGKGVLTTVALAIDPETLRINADATGGSVRLEVMDPWGRVLSGYSKDDCVPFSGNDTNYQIKWKSNQSPQKSKASSSGLEGKMVSQSRGSLKVKVYLDKAKLFALYSEGTGADTQRI